MAGVVIAHDIGAVGNTVVLVPCSRSGTFAPSTTWAYMGGGGGRAWTIASNDTCMSPSVTYSTKVCCLTLTGLLAYFRASSY